MSSSSSSSDESEILSYLKGFTGFLDFFGFLLLFLLWFLFGGNLFRAIGIKLETMKMCGWTKLTSFPVFFRPWLAPLVLLAQFLSKTLLLSQAYSNTTPWVTIYFVVHKLIKSIWLRVVHSGWGLLIAPFSTSIFITSGNYWTLSTVNMGIFTVRSPWWRLHFSVIASLGFKITILFLFQSVSVSESVNCVITRLGTRANTGNHDNFGACHILSHERVSQSKSELTGSEWNMGFFGVHGPDTLL